MYWTLELASKLEDAPWPATKEELIDYAVRSGAPVLLSRLFYSIFKITITFFPSGCYLQSFFRIEVCAVFLLVIFC